MSKRRGRKPRLSGPVKRPYTIVVEEYETVCQICDAEFLDEEDLKMHVSQVHLDKCNGRMLCKVCFVLLPGAELFVYHFIVKHLESAVFCFYCHRMFSDPLQLDQHELKHRAVADDASVRCSQCPSILRDRHELQDHEYQAHSSSQDGLLLHPFYSLLSGELNMTIKKFLDCLCKKEPLVCRKCNLSTTNLTDYIEHLKTVKCKCFACDKCCNVYKKKCSILSHVQKNKVCHNFVSEQMIIKPCPKCNKYFNNTEMSSHIKSCSVVKCSNCDKQFNSVLELTDHCIEAHEVRISLVTCKLCNKQFVGTLNLKKHMERSHKNLSQYKYKCVHCGSLFAHPQRLFAHFFTKHKDIEPYTCLICNQRYRLRKHFTYHIKLRHKGVGSVEFDKDLHVIFTAKKSQNPNTTRTSLTMDSTTESDIDSDAGVQQTLNQNSNSTAEEATQEEDNDNLEAVQLNLDNCPNVEENGNPAISNNSLDVEIEIIDLSTENSKRKSTIRAPIETVPVNSPDELSENSEEEPLSKVRDVIIRENTRNKTYLNRKTVSRNKRAKLTCKICKKYCYTVQNYHHHLTLHEKTKMKRCIKCNEYFKSRQDLKEHIERSHSSSKLIETLKSVLEKRKNRQPTKLRTAADRAPGESLKSILAKRKKQQLIAQAVENSAATKFRRTIRKVDCVDDCVATITPMSDHGLSVKNFIENFRPEGDSVSISNSVTLKAVYAVRRDPAIKMRAFNTSPQRETVGKLKPPVKFKDTGETDTKISVKLVQQLITKPKAVNMVYNEKIPTAEEDSEPDEYCNTFADETDYTQYKNDSIPEVAQEVMLGDPEDIPRTRRLAREIIIPRIPEEYGGVRIGHLLPEAPYYKIVKVKKLLNPESDQPKNPDGLDKDVQLPDGTRLISVKNPYSHLIPNDHLQEILKANRTKYYTPKTKNIEKAIAKALNQGKPPQVRGRRKKVDTSSTQPELSILEH